MGLLLIVRGGDEFEPGWEGEREGGGGGELKTLMAGICVSLSPSLLLFGVSFLC